MTVFMALVPCSLTYSLPSGVMMIRSNTFGGYSERRRGGEGRDEEGSEGVGLTKDGRGGEEETKRWRDGGNRIGILQLNKLMKLS